MQIIEVLGDAFEIADAVGVGVLKGARVNLIDDSFFPPLGLVAIDQHGGLRRRGLHDCGCALAENVWWQTESKTCKG